MHTENKIKSKKLWKGKRTKIPLALGIITALSLSGLAGYTSATELISQPGELSIDDSLQLTYSFSSPTIAHEPLGTIISLGDLPSIGNPGEPILPQKTIEILVPFGKDVANIAVDPGKSVMLPGTYMIAHGQKPIPLSYKEEATLTESNPMIYDSATQFPGCFYKRVTTQRLCGYMILILNLYPLQYSPKNGAISFYPELTVTIDFCQNIDASNRVPHRSLPGDIARIKKFVDNPEMVKTYTFGTDIPETLSYGSKGGFVDPSDTYEYVVITNATLENSMGEYTFQDLIQSKIDRGLTATIVAVEDIYVNYGGVDQQEQIRNFIIDAYQNWETQYVLLGGDGDGADVGNESGDNIVPSRALFALVVPEDPDSGDLIAADLYYACLDGSYDANANGVYGEVGDGADI
jgi:hypothetical protein